MEILAVLILWLHVSAGDGIRIGACKIYSFPLAFRVSGGEQGGNGNIFGGWIANVPVQVGKP